MLLSQFSGRRIKRPEKGLLSMHPFVDVLEGRNLFTATLQDGVLNVHAVIDAPASDDTPSFWSQEPITADDLSADDSGGGLSELLATTTPNVIELGHGVAASAFATDTIIGDDAQTLFGNALYDRRGRFEQQPLPSDEQIAAARENMADSPFRAGRPLTGAMAPYLTMTVHHETHPFAL
jgi:hypothetical protein